MAKQHSNERAPYGYADISGALVAQQTYDVSVSVSLPRTPDNVGAGNFMLGVALLRPGTVEDTQQRSRSTFDRIDKKAVLREWHRTTCLTYRSRLVSLAQRLLALPLYVAGIRVEAEELLVSMGDEVVFARGRANVADVVVVELQRMGTDEGKQLQVYEVRVHITAVLGGLRWWMYHRRFVSFVLLVALFWMAEMGFAVVGWVGVRWYLHSGDSVVVTEQPGNVKMEESSEEDVMSDTSRTFPTYGKQLPLKYDKPVKQEEDALSGVAATHLFTTAEADDEDEDDLNSMDVHRSDSGLGTSYSEGRDRSGLAKRRSKAKTET